MKYPFLLLIYLVSLSVTYAQNRGVESLDTTVNSPVNEMNPVLHPDGKTLYFTRANHPGNVGGKKDKGDIWISVLGNNGWGAAKNAGNPLNNEGFNAVVGFSEDGNTMFLHNIYYRNNNSPITQGVSVSHRRGDSWSFPEPLPIRYFYNRSEHQSISISRDGRIMLMAIESYGTYGTEDIYVSFQRSTGEWTDPLNLGPDVNTRFQEMTPVLLKDNKTLIFASNGHGGEGSMDLFYSERLDDTWMKWSKPVNLGPEINTRGREMYYALSPDEEYAYFISTQNSEGYGDIKRIKLRQEDLAKQIEAPAIQEQEMVLDEVTIDPEFHLLVEGRVMNIKNQEPIAAKLLFTKVGDASSLGVEKNVEGSYQVLLPRGSYTIKATATGFMTLEDQVEVRADVMTTVKNFELLPLDVGATFRLNNVLFVRGTTELMESSYPELNQVVDLLKDNPQIKIELSGHTDNQGSSRENLRLSQQRVDAVKQYLTERGVNTDRITGRGYGGSRPVASNNSEETRRLNRRVEFTILQN